MRFVQLIDPRNLHRLLLIFLCKVVNSSIVVYSTSLSSSQLPKAGETSLDGTALCLVTSTETKFSMPQSITLVLKRVTKLVAWSSQQ